MGKLTATRIKSIKEPGRYVDGAGLMLNVTSSGSKSWVLRVQHDGRRRDFGLGSERDVTLSEARDEARRLRRMVRKGLDPLAERRKELSRNKTFRMAAEDYHSAHYKTWKNGKHRDQWINTLRSYAFPRIGDLTLDIIDGPMIVDVLSPIWLEKPETARRVKQRIGAVLDYAHARGWREGEAPMRAVAKGLPSQPKKTGRFKAMPYAEVPRFVAKLREIESFGALALEALILTACRSGEIRGACWDEIDFDAKLWTIPAGRMKAGRLHVVPLSKQALEVFERAAALRIADTPLVFPGQKRGKPLSDMTLLKILRDQNEPYTVHGFRSSFRDWAAECSDQPGEVAEAALAHTVPNAVEAAYRRTDFLDRRRLLMNDWADHAK
ncbi:MAG: integrase arm-type DNA-binding domain-containing protein [Parasphingopyxis sp.]|uniref:tyrosine-type recombinase/integrase n=1 Tax=Parasphingopyxis sp. TaxID=1920299 RepID=UPI0032EE25B6